MDSHFEAAKTTVLPSVLRLSKKRKLISQEELVAKIEKRRESVRVNARKFRQSAHGKIKITSYVAQVSRKHFLFPCL